MKKIRNFFSIGAGRLSPIMTGVALLYSQTVTATFQSASEFDQHQQFEKNMRTANPPGQTQRQPNPYRNDGMDGYRTEQEYYEEVAPSNDEEDRNYLLQNHPIQEAPLPSERV